MNPQRPITPLDERATPNPRDERATTRDRSDRMAQTEPNLSGERMGNPEPNLSRDRMAQTEPNLSGKDAFEKDMFDKDAFDKGDFDKGAQTLPPTHGDALADESSDHETPYLPDQASAQAGDRWQQIQAQFVDDPRRAVGQAHELVGELVQQVIDGFSRERDTLEQQWSKGDSVSTEDLRVALQSYRAFFSRLLPSARASRERR
jgi:hypothetical protein